MSSLQSSKSRLPRQLLPSGWRRTTSYYFFKNNIWLEYGSVLGVTKTTQGYGLTRSTHSSTSKIYWRERLKQNTAKGKPQRAKSRRNQARDLSSAPRESHTVFPLWTVTPGMRCMQQGSAQRHNAHGYFLERRWGLSCRYPLLNIAKLKTSRRKIHMCLKPHGL